MALINCPECSRDISDKATSCPHCGFPMTPKSGRNVNCLDCGRAYPFSTEVCPACGLLNTQKHAGGETAPGMEPMPVLPDKEFTFVPPPRKKREWDRSILYGSAAIVGVLLFAVTLIDDKEEAPQKGQLSARYETLVARLDELIAKGSLVDAYQLGIESDLARAPGVKERIEKIAPKALEQIAAAEAAQRKKQEAELLAKVKALPASPAVANRDAYAELCKLVPGNKLYQEKFALYDRLTKKEEQQFQERLERFGAVPIYNGWDGSYYEVKFYLKQVANDPDSIKLDGCSKVYGSDSGWLVACNYLGRNAFGGMIRKSNWFTIRNGRVVNMEPASAHTL